MVSHSRRSRPRPRALLDLRAPTPEIRVLKALSWNAAPLTLELLAAQTLLPRDEVASALHVLLHEGRVLHFGPSGQDLFRGAYALIPLSSPPL